MKFKQNIQYLSLCIVMTFLVSCKAQVVQDTKPLYSNNEWRTAAANTYFKDSNNDLGRLVGKWRFIDGAETLEIDLVLKEQHHTNLSYSGLQFDQDFLYGEYKYTNEESEALVNSLADLQSSVDPFDHLIKGNYITNINNTELCETCTNELAVKLHIDDPQRDYIPYVMYVQHIPANSQGNPMEQIRLVIRINDMTIVPEGEPTDTRIRLGFYTLNKVE
ncbi:DUF6705 family protein [Croceibacter atlanticus]|uniref:DUF6705 family protein n=1 Tax=Croceibacter atlanticus TaxID=313588 RepID=UPI0030D96B2D